MSLRNSAISRLLNTKYPIIQAPMFGVTTPEMVIAAANADCLGSLAVADLPAEKCIELIKIVKQQTDKPFAVNIFVNEIPAIDDDLRKKYTAVKHHLEELAKQYKFDVVLPQIDDLKINGYHEQIDAIISENINIVSFTFGNLDAVSINKLKNNNVTLIGTCTSVEEAITLERSGIDIICVQGLEAGGHRGSFATENIPLISGISLLARVYENVKVPIIYAGGIYNANTLIAAKTLGAQGFQIGSLLLTSKESALQDFEKQRLFNVKENDIVLTKGFSGRYARGIKNTFIDTIENSDFILPYPYQNKLTGAFRAAARKQQNADFVNIWTGQSAGNFSERPTSEILTKLINDVRDFNS